LPTIQHGLLIWASGQYTLANGELDCADLRHNMPLYSEGLWREMRDRRNNPHLRRCFGSLGLFRLSRIVSVHLGLFRPASSRIVVPVFVTGIELSVDGG
jgi:hypothetical protein